MDKNLLQRSLSGLVYVMVVMLCTHPKGAELINSIQPNLVEQYQLYFALITLFVIVGTYECVRLMKFGNGYEKWVVYPFTAFAYYLFAKRYLANSFSYDANASELLTVALVGIAVVTLFKYTYEIYVDSGKMIFTVVYLAIPFGLSLALPSYSSINDTFTLEAFFLFILIWSSDTFAYIFGRMFGKHKMAPKISPKKTWEGFAGGVICTMIIGYFIEGYDPSLKGNWMFVGFLASVFAPFGDLVESKLKRSFGVKDSGNFIPGHGGILDRLDSFMMCAPAVYLYFIIDHTFLN